MARTNRLRLGVALFIGLYAATFGIAKISVSEDDYFDYVTVFSNGRIARFTEMPIRVYISPMLRTDVYLNAIRYGMRQWELAAGGIIEFVETEDNGDADIRVSWGHARALANHRSNRRQSRTHASGMGIASESR